MGTTPPRGLPARGGPSIPVEGRMVSRNEGGKEKKNAHASLGGSVCIQCEFSTVCDVANVALFGKVPTVDFVTRGNSPSRSPAAPHSPHQPHRPHPPFFCDTTTPHPYALGRVFSLASFGRTLPAYVVGCAAFFFILVCLFFSLFSSLPADRFSSLSS